MHKNTIIYIFLFVFGIYFVQAQKKKKEIPLLTDSLPTTTTSLLFDFPYLNIYPEYYDEKQMAVLSELDKKEDWQRLYVALKEYVSRFGIRNFYKDTRLIWKLAKLSELLGYKEEAKSLYRLVLRHHYQEINLKEIELYYDSLNRQEASQFVPIEYYYEMADHRALIDTLRPPRGVLLNMGPAINSKKADYGPTLNHSNEVLLFTSKRNERDVTVAMKEDEDLYFSLRDDYGAWTDAEPLSMINTPYNEGSAYLSKDKQTLFFSRCNSPEGFGDCDLFIASLQIDSTWGEIKNIGLNVNSVSWDSHPALSANEDTLFFASDRLGGFGMSDIYYSIKDSKGEWLPAKNIGPIINTRNNEVSPFFHPDAHMLYFTSNGQLYNFGEFDIYKASANGKFWTEPVNIGPLVNGKGSEFYFTIDTRSEYLYYARSVDRDLNKMDLFSFPLPMEAQPYANTLLTGTLTDSLSGKPFKGIVSIIDLDEGIEVAPKFLRPDGSFEFKLIDQRNYLLVIQGDDFFRIEQAFFLDGPTELKKVTEPLAARVKFESIEFDLGQSQLKLSMYADINKIVNFLYDNPEFKLKISGHTDSYGSEDFNLKLSRERAQNIANYITEFAGILEVRVDWEGYGSSRPIVEEFTEADKALNRRVEFEIYREGSKPPSEIPKNE